MNNHDCVNMAFAKKLNINDLYSVSNCLDRIRSASNVYKIDALVLWKNLEANLSDKIWELRHCSKKYTRSVFRWVFGLFISGLSIAYLWEIGCKFGVPSSYFFGSLAGVLSSLLSAYSLVFSQKLAVCLSNWFKALLGLSATLMGLLFSIISHAENVAFLYSAIESLLLASFWFIFGWGITFLSTNGYRNNIRYAEELDRARDLLISAGLILAKCPENKND